jgi:hypothetical protein
MISVPSHASFVLFALSSGDILKLNTEQLVISEAWILEEKGKSYTNSLQIYGHYLA